MSWPDMVNAGFEAGAGVAVLLHCARLHEDKQVRGMSITAVVFFTLWGLWNIFYYPFLGQFWSFVGGIFVTVANLFYVAMLVFYSRHHMARWIKRQTVCRIRGHRNDAPYFTIGYALYPCKHCGEDIFGNTWDDIEPMPDDLRDQVESLDMVYGAGGRP